MMQRMRDATLVAVIFGVSVAYAVVRYNVFKGVSYEQMPLYVTNKAVAVTSLVLLGVARLVADKRRRKGLGIAAAVLAGVHVLISYVVMQPAYLDQLYLPSGTLRWNGEVSMLAGALAAVPIAWLVHATAARPLEVQVDRSLLPGLGRAALALVALHALFMGYAGWLDVASWPGMMPPLTLLSFLVALACLSWPRRRSRT
jgi:hypothetical protein